MVMDLDEPSNSLLGTSMFGDEGHCFFVALTDAQSDIEIDLGITRLWIEAPRQFVLLVAATLPCLLLGKAGQQIVRNSHDIVGYITQLIPNVEVPVNAQGDRMEYVLRDHRGLLLEVRCQVLKRSLHFLDHKVSLAFPVCLIERKSDKEQVMDWHGKRKQPTTGRYEGPKCLITVCFEVLTGRTDGVSIEIVEDRFRKDEARL